MASKGKDVFKVFIQDLTTNPALTDLDSLVTTDCERSAFSQFIEYRKQDSLGGTRKVIIIKKNNKVLMIHQFDAPPGHRRSVSIH